jgi:hypothetical protein
VVRRDNPDEEQAMNPCCEKWVGSLRPQNPKEGRFTETRQCSKCKTWHRIHFECLRTEDGNLDCSVIDTEPP